MKVRITQDHEGVKAGTVYDVKEIRSNTYGVALIFDVLPPVTLPNISFLEKVTEEPRANRIRSTKPNEENTA